MNEIQERAKALGFRSIERMEEHQRWLEEYGTPEYRRWLEMRYALKEHRRAMGRVILTAIFTPMIVFVLYAICVTLRLFS